MAPICFNKMLPDSDRFLLKKIARDAIHYGLANDTPMPLDTGCLPTSVLEKQASFVTLFIAGALRGCIGSLTAVYPLAEDVAKMPMLPHFVIVVLSRLQNRLLLI